MIEKTKNTAKLQKQKNFQLNFNYYLLQLLYYINKYYR